MQIDKQHFLNSPEQGEIRPSWINRFRQFSITNSILTMIAWFSTGVLVWKPHCSFHNVQCVLCRGTWGCFRYTFQPSCHSWHQLLESCFHCHFYNPRQSPSHLSKRKTLLDLCYICPRGTREGMPYFVFEKSVFVKHTIEYVVSYSCSSLSCAQSDTWEWRLPGHGANILTNDL